MANPKYLKGLSPSDKKKKEKNIEKTKELLKKGKKKEAIEISKKRPTVSKSKKSPWIIKFRNKYGDVKIPSQELAKLSGISLSNQKKIIEKGRGAFLSSGSRASVSSPTQWGIARLASAFMGGPAAKIDKDLIKNLKK